VGLTPKGGRVRAAYFWHYGGDIVAYNNALSAYRETRIKTASQGQLIIMLYDKAVQYLDQGLELLEMNSNGKKNPGNIEKINKTILKTQEIITELTVSLDFDQGGEIAKNLFSLYTWFNQQLLEANIKQDPYRVKVVRNLLSELREAWNEIAAKTPETAGKAVGGINIAG
jgi:flagellar protein FliS